jgi:hypothetical protein
MTHTDYLFRNFSFQIRFQIAVLLLLFSFVNENQHLEFINFISESSILLFMWYLSRRSLNFEIMANIFQIDYEFLKRLRFNQNIFFLTIQKN